MGTTRFHCACSAFAALVLFVPAVVWAAEDGGLASEYPWSGYWWQHRSGGLVAPLQKYDRVAATAAAQWEQEEHVYADAPEWFGHCHAWAASSVLEKEPRSVQNVAQVAFGVGDQKGLLAACHAQDIANSYGDRYGDGAGSEEHADLAPDELWQLLQMYVKRQKLPLILDLESGEQVWNYPVYQYRVQYNHRGDGWYNGSMQLFATDNNVRPDYLGTQYTLHQYAFQVRIQNGAIVLGSGKWTGNSVQDHPDFAWYPFVAVAENPELHVDQVSQIVGYEVGGEQASPDDDDRDIHVDPESNDEDEESEDDPDPLPPDVDPDDDIEPAPPTDEEDVLGPYELVDAVLNQTSHFVLDVFVDRGDGGRYRPGEPVAIAAQSSEAGYLYLFDVDRQGNLRLVFPRLGEPNRIDAGITYDLPIPGAPALLRAEGQGQHDLKAIVLTRPIRITGFQQNRQQQSQQIQMGGPSVQQTKPQRIVLHPAAQTQMKRLLKSASQLDEKPQKPPKKMRRFAQDRCAYFVLSSTSQQQDSR